jgi:phage baseplate assembly protein W
MTEEEQTIPTMAPGLMQAYTDEAPEETPDRRRRKNQYDPIAALRKWEPRTRLGAAVMAGKIIPTKPHLHLVYLSVKFKSLTHLSLTSKMKSSP